VGQPTATFTTMGSAAAAAAAGKLGAEDDGDGSSEQQQQQQELWPAWKQQFIDAIEYDSKASEDGEEPGEWFDLGHWAAAVRKQRVAAAGAGGDGVTAPHSAELCRVKVGRSVTACSILR
jgi:hypothetical protein